MTTKKVERRIKIKFRIRKNVNGTAERPRLSVFRSNKQIYAQVINDLTGTTLASASSLGLEKMPKQEQAEKVGELVAEKAKAAGVEAVVFDRNGRTRLHRYPADRTSARDPARRQPSSLRPVHRCQDPRRPLGRGRGSGRTCCLPGIRGF